MNGTDATKPLLEKIDAREQALTCEPEQIRARIEDLAGRLRELDQDIDYRPNGVHRIAADNIGVDAHEEVLELAYWKANAHLVPVKITGLHLYNVFG